MINNKEGDTPYGTFNIFSTLAVIIGIVVGIGIFRLPPLVAANASSEMQFIAFWIFGGFVSIMGALCYAELSSSMPNAGGEYFFLRKAYGPITSFLFSWGRMTVIQTGSLVIVAYILGDYMSEIYTLGSYSTSVYAALSIIILTLLNIIGTQPSKVAQNTLTATILSAIIILVVMSFFKTPETNGLVFSEDIGFLSLFNSGTPGLAMIFVMLTYGGWNEAAYLTAEIKNVRKNIAKTLIFGILTITFLYVLINLAYLRMLGFEYLKNAQTVGNDLAVLVLGPKGALIMIGIVIITALSTANATIMTGARTNYAMGRDFHLFRFMGKWHAKRKGPVNALIIQGFIALVLVAVGAWSKQGIATMVDYTAPVFWSFLLLITLSIFLFRLKKQVPAGAYRIPLYPLPPVLFLLACGYMLYSSLAYTGAGALLGVAVLIAGLPLWLISESPLKKR